MLCEWWQTSGVRARGGLPPPCDSTPPRPSVDASTPSGRSGRFCAWGKVPHCRVLPRDYRCLAGVLPRVRALAFHYRSRTGARMA